MMGKDIRMILLTDLRDTQHIARRARAMLEEVSEILFLLRGGHGSIGELAARGRDERIGGTIERLG
ncbi:MAG: hypothetical protein ACLU4J_13815 [Butyricimonas paravirosa]